MEMFTAVINLVVVAIVTAVLLAMPVLSRREFMFGITVSPELRDASEGHAILRGYAFGITGSALGCALLVLASMQLFSGNARAGGQAAGPVLMLLASFAFYLRARAQAAKHAVAAERRRELLLAPQARITDLLPRPLAWHALPYLVLAAAGIWLAAHWDAIPGTYPDHLGIGGKIDGYAHKSVAAVFAPLAMGLLTVVLLHLTMLLGLLVRRLPDTLGRARLLNVALLELASFLSLMVAGLALMPLYGVGLLTGAASQAVFVLLLLTMILVPGVTLLRGLQRLRTAHPEGGRGDRTADRAWILGSFYFNRDDPSMFVEKRFGVGYTMNLAHPAVYLIIAGVLLMVTLALLGSLSTRAG